MGEGKNINTNQSLEEADSTVKDDLGNNCRCSGNSERTRIRRGPEDVTELLQSYGTIFMGESRKWCLRWKPHLVKML